MSNTHLNVSMIAKEMLRELKNQLVFARSINRQYSDEFAKKGAKIGNVINIRKPHRFEVTDGASLTIQGTTDQSVALTLDKRKHVAFQFSSQELALNIDEFSKRYVRPAVAVLANQVDVDLAALVKTSIWNSVGTPGTGPSSASAAMLLALQAGQKLDENGCPMGERSMILNPAAQATFVSQLSSLFQSGEQLKKQYEKGLMGTAAGFTWKMGQNVASHTTGAIAGTPLVKTTIAAEGATAIAVDGITGSITDCYKAGDVIQIADVYAVNPVTKESTGSLMQFVVTADTDSSSNEIASLPISPAMYLTGPYQNISAYPVDGAAITLFGHATNYASKTTACNVAFHPDAFTLGMADLDLPGGVDKAARATDPDSGLSLRVVRDYDINDDVWPCRVDILYGVKAIYPELACRVHM